MKAKPILNAALAAALVLSLAACGGSDSSSKSSKKDNSGKTQSSEKTESADESSREENDFTDWLKSDPKVLEAYKALSSDPRDYFFLFDALEEAEGVSSADSGADPESVLERLYEALLIKKDFDTVFRLTVPDELYEEMQRSEAEEFDEVPADFDYYTYEKQVYERAWERTPSSGGWYEILACEDIDTAGSGEVNRVINGKRKKGDDYWDIGTRDDYDYADAGTVVYAAAVQWGFSDVDGDPYSETELLWVYCLNGSWYVDGSIW